MIAIGVIFSQQNHQNYQSIKMLKLNLSYFYGNIKNQIAHIPRSIKMPPEHYIEPKQWNLKFEKPSQVSARAFINYPQFEKIGKEETSAYKNPEYFSYHPYSYYSIEEDLFFKRCKPQPSPFRKVTFDGN